MNEQRKKLEFVLVDIHQRPLAVYRFLLNPQEYSITHPIRIRATQTKGGVFIDDFGLGIGTLSIKGIIKNDFVEDSFGQVRNLALERFQELRKLVTEDLFSSRQPGQPPNRLLEVRNYTDNDFFLTLPTNFSLQRSVNKPLFYNYSIDLLILRRLGYPPKAKPDPVLEQVNQSLSPSGIMMDILGSWVLVNR
ncbi:hypothetical protein [Candidatus Caldatribacterium sp.]|uniref:hypothetical protein n=1 Tax=Candidatus Caldatribacterium sp. TaxID=2282143 RepID=UPI00383E9337|nr:hypothetical protein [Candidatus Caldatribacterium sp.]